MMAGKDKPSMGEPGDRGQGERACLRSLPALLVLLVLAAMQQAGLDRQAEERA